MRWRHDMRQVTGQVWRGVSCPPGSACLVEAEAAQRVNVGAVDVEDGLEGASSLAPSCAASGIAASNGA